MGTNNIVFLEILEWFDQTGQELLYRLPEQGSGEIKFGAQLIVRESQAAVFFYNGKAYDAFQPGRHTLMTANIPILTKVLSLPWGMSSPLRAEVYFVNMKIFPDLKWGTRDPVAFKDSELGLIRLRAFGVYNIRVLQPVLFINSLVGTKGVYSTQEIEDYLGRVIISRFNDYMGEEIDTIFNLPGKYDEMADGLMERLQQDFSHFGLGLTNLYITAITPPAEVQQAIDDKSRLEVFDNLNNLIKMKAAMSMEKASESQGEAGAGMGLGMGFMMPALFAETFKGGTAGGASQPQPQEPVTCPDCHQPIAPDARFCPYCGHQVVVLNQCSECGKNLPASAKFCPRCGTRVEERAKAKFCSNCGAENITEATFCNQCGERL